MGLNDFVLIMHRTFELMVEGIVLLVINLCHPYIKEGTMKDLEF